MCVKLLITDIHLQVVNYWRFQLVPGLTNQTKADELKTLHFKPSSYVNQTTLNLREGSNLRGCYLSVTCMPSGWMSVSIVCNFHFKVLAFVSKIHVLWCSLKKKKKTLSSRTENWSNNVAVIPGLNLLIKSYFCSTLICICEQEWNQLSFTYHELKKWVREDTLMTELWRNAPTQIEENSSRCSFWFTVSESLIILPAFFK